MATLSVATDVTSSFHSRNCSSLKDVRILDDKPLGIGAYGKVFEVQYVGKSCAAKEIHSIFFQMAKPQELERLKSNFLRECSIWSTLHHPNIVTLIGLYFSDNDNTGIPIMVMEKMECTLTSLIENTAVGGIDLQRKLSILHDVSGGLWHLHSLDPPIIHRDLTPNNILLRQGEAKISDLGVSKIMQNTASGKMTKAPGTPGFMPPETFVDNPRYGTAVDIFSYAGIVLYAIIEKWPSPTAREKYNTENQRPEIVSEVDRRQDYISKMTEYRGEKLRPLVVSCLNDKPELRPHIAEVSIEIDAFKKSLDNCSDFDFVSPTALHVQHKPSDSPELQRLEETLKHQCTYKQQEKQGHAKNTIKQLKLTMKDALAIQSYFPQEELQKVDPQLLLDVTLHKIMTCEYENGLCCYNSSSNSSWNDVVAEDDSFDGHGNDKEDNSIHPVDNLINLIHCSDNILRQNIMLKLSLCQVATPLLLPDHSNNSVTFLLWALRSVVKRWKDGEKVIEAAIVDHPLPVVSFLRIGNVCLSKSDILNQVIGDFKYFFFREYKGVNCKKKSTEGLVDFCCYLPGESRTDLLSANPILFFNLHGDAQNSKKQVKFIQKLSVLSIIFVNAYDSAVTKVINNLAKNNKTVVFIQKDHSNNYLTLSHKNIDQCPFSIMDATSISKFVKKIQNHVTETVNNHAKTFVLKKTWEIAKDCGILIDEDDSDCQLASKKAIEIFDQLKQYSPQEAKLKTFPLQGPDNWQSWTEIDRKQYQEFGKQTSDLEKYKAQRDAQKTKIRTNMKHHCYNLTTPVNTFINVLSNSFNITTEMHYFLAWLKLLLDRYNRKKFHDVKDNNRIGLEHFFREMGQIYETLQYLKIESGNHTKYPRIIAKLMIEGYCTELMDGESNHVPVVWISAILKEFQIICKDSTFHTISIIGGQSTGKSTLLNTMFGLNFNTSVGKCTQGAIMQLLSFSKDTTRASNCDYILLIDTEGLKAPERLMNNKHDNQLATFIIGLADIAIINLGNENPTELCDVLQIVCHALIRINKIQINLSCKFVHHQITQPGARTTLDKERKKMFSENLDEYVQEVCKLEYCHKYKSFSELLNFDVEQDTFCFKPLWYGNPPMAKVNKAYVEDIQTLKMSLIDHCYASQHTLSFADFSVKIKLLWNAVLREQFLFSFKNTLEVIAHKEYDRKHCEWDAEFRSEVLKWESEAEISFLSDKSQEPKERKATLLNKVEKVLMETQQRVLEKRDKYFAESKYAPILREWESKSIRKINDCYQEYTEQVNYIISQLYIKCINEIEMAKMTSRIPRKLDMLADNLCSSDVDTWLPDDSLEEIFNDEWATWLSEIKPIEYRSSKEIEHQILQILQKHFNMDRNILNQKLLTTPLGEWSTKFKINANVHLQIKNSPSSEPSTDEGSSCKAQSLVCNWLNEFEYAETQNVHTILQQFDYQLSELIKKFEKAKPDILFTKECIFDTALTACKQTTDILITIEETARMYTKLEFQNKKQEYLKLLCVYYDNKKNQQQISMAIQKQKAQTNTELQHSCNVQREETLIEFEASLHKDKIVESQILDKQTCNAKDKVKQQKSHSEAGIEEYDANMQEINKQDKIEKSQADSLADSHKKVINYLCEIIKTALNKNIRTSAKFEVFKDITESNSIFQSKENFKSSLLELLLQGKKFDEYKLYFTDPKECYKKWMCHFVDAHCLETDTSTGHNKFYKLTKHTIEKLLKSVHTAITVTNIDSNNLTFSFWINEFSANAKNENISVIQNDIQYISQIVLPWRSSDDAKAFKDLFSEEIMNLNMLDSQVVYNDIKDQLNTFMWKNLKKTLLGCTACCPFCKEMCDGESVCAEGDQHSVRLHRPQCLAKLLHHPTRSIVVDICTTSVGSNCKFRNKDTRWKWIPYKQYDSIYPHWYISDAVESTKPYWKWVVAYFGREIAEWCGYGKFDSIPHEWHKTTEETSL